ncbi:MAG: nucleotidyltransferase family protein [Pyrinomonadaceae bacterium]
MTTDTQRWNLLHRKAQQAKSVRAVELLRAAGIEPILIKGIAAEQYYPGDRIRPSIDIDLAVAEADFERANRLSRSDAAEGMAIDLHKELRHLDTLEWQDLFERSKLLQFENGSIRLLCAEDNLRVLCVHWLTDGGVYQERLWDIYYAVANRPADFNWDRFLGVVSERRRRWLVCTVGLAGRYLGLDLSDTPILDEASKLPKWLTDAVEREWGDKVKPRPLEVSLNDPKILIGQVKRRFRPNPIRATVQMEGSFDARTRFFYRLGNFFMRIPSSYRRVSEALRTK